MVLSPKICDFDFLAISFIILLLSTAIFFKVSSAQQSADYDLLITMLNHTDIDIQFYPLAGTTVHEIVANCKIQGHYDEKTEERYCGYCQYFLTYQLSYDYNLDWQYVNNYDKIYIAQIIYYPSIQITHTLYLPDPAIREHISPLQYDLFDLWYSSLLQHEYEHYLISSSSQIIQSFKDKLKDEALYTQEVAMGEEFNEQTLNQWINSTTQTIAQSITQRIDFYYQQLDELSDHGAMDYNRQEFFDHLVF